MHRLRRTNGTPRRLRGSAAALAILAAGGGVATVATARPSTGDGFRTAAPALAEAVPGTGWQVTPILSSGDEVPETGNPGGRYRMVGVADGLGVERLRGRSGLVRVLMSHELTHQGRQTDPLVDRPRQRGAFVDEWLMTRDGRVVSGRRAYDAVYQDGTYVGPPADSTNTTPPFSRFCSAFLAGRDDGFDRSIFFANEETPGVGFSPKGSQTVAIFDQEAHALSALGHFPRENTVVVPDTGRRTMLLITEDGPARPDSQLYLYVGEKARWSDDPLRRNGLVGGRLYAFASDDDRDTENALLQGDQVHGRWVEIPRAAELTDPETEAVLDEAGAFGFVRLEDGAFRPTRDREFYFASTGDQVVPAGQPELRDDPRHNELGRLYRLTFDRRNPLRGATLTQVFNPDQPPHVAQGPISPDNLDAVRDGLIVSEDGTGSSRPHMEARGHDGSIWMLPFSGIDQPSTYQRIVELLGRSVGGRDGKPSRIAGIWETTGTVSARRAFGADTYLFNVMAHESKVPGDPPGAASRVVDEGQLLLLGPDPSA